MNRQWVYAVVAVVALAAGPVGADVWDLAGDSDNGIQTDNELLHGTEQVHDLGALAGPTEDQDWYRVTLPPYSSFEALITGFTGDLQASSAVDMLFDRLDSSVVVTQNHACISASCFGKRLTWRNLTGIEELSYLRVSAPGCGTACTTADQYTIRARETTISVARFNNSGSQITVLMTQNNGTTTVNATIHYWSAAGGLITTSVLAIPPRGLSVVNTAGIGALSGLSGSATVVHDGSYGQLNVKTVALEPSTGFSFDTPGVYKGL